MVAFVLVRGAGEPGDAAEGHGATATAGTAHRSVGHWLAVATAGERRLTLI